MKLGVNIDHIATLRQARYRGCRDYGWAEPSLLMAADLVYQAGAHGITIHLREDRRHIQDEDVERIKHWGKLPLNLEMACYPEIINIAARILPQEVCFVPEKRQEITTEGGLDVLSGGKKLRKAIEVLKKKGIRINLFINPDPKQIHGAAQSGAHGIELHTGAFASAKTSKQIQKEWKRLYRGAELAHGLGLGVNAGHGLRCSHIQKIKRISYLETLNIGHSIISRAVIVGLRQAIREFLFKIKSI